MANGKPNILALRDYVIQPPTDLNVHFAGRSGDDSQLRRLRGFFFRHVPRADIDLRGIEQPLCVQPLPGARPAPTPPASTQTPQH